MPIVRVNAAGAETGRVKVQWIYGIQKNWILKQRVQCCCNFVHGQWTCYLKTYFFRISCTHQTLSLHAGFCTCCTQKVCRSTMLLTSL